ncbi:uncharacterized protein [Polyergus mexicanus]|uniref:uncharacterized protein n=1 Tax=Polyergus mexicanus TaxID=615972 RepID=UPI0038B640DB
MTDQVVLLGLHCSLKEDIKTSATEMVYGTAHRLPAKYFYDEQTQIDPHIFIKRFCEQMRNVRPMMTAHHVKRRHLHACFLRVDRVRGALEASYEGPFEIIQRLTDRLLKVRIKGEAVNVPIKRLKPGYPMRIMRETERTPAFTEIQDTEDEPSGHQEIINTQAPRAQTPKPTGHREITGPMTKTTNDTSATGLLIGFPLSTGVIRRDHSSGLDLGDITLLTTVIKI